jgi:hypothetical protein
MLTITPSMAVQIYTKLLTLFCIIFLFVYFQCINTEDDLVVIGVVHSLVFCVVFCRLIFVTDNNKGSTNLGTHENTINDEHLDEMVYDDDKKCELLNKYFSLVISSLSSSALNDTSSTSSGGTSIRAAARLTNSWRFEPLVR